MKKLAAFLLMSMVIQVLNASASAAPSQKLTCSYGCDGSRSNSPKCFVGHVPTRNFVGALWYDELDFLEKAQTKLDDQQLCYDNYYEPNCRIKLTFKDTLPYGHDEYTIFYEANGQTMSYAGNRTMILARMAEFETAARINVCAWE